MKALKEMSLSELLTEFDCYAAETGMDREYDYDQEEAFTQWLEDNEIELEEDE
jgi:hypothetical protein